jgi:5-methyltetrahydropteroyltriglutamate--homocysteine methyltransferase
MGPAQHRPVRAEHIGSLLRPPRLLEARRQLADGEIDAEALRAVEDEAIVEALRRQEAIGIDVIGDGEFRRTDFRAGFAAALSGLREDEYDGAWHGATGAVAVRSRTWRVVDRVERVAPISVDEARFVRDHTAVPFKVTLPAPGYVAERFHGAGDASPYRDARALAETFIEILRQEVIDLIELGVPYIQIDNPGYATFLDDAARARVAAEGRDPDVAFRDMLATDRALLAGIPRGAALIGLHVCRGNNAGSWLHQGSYAPIAEELFASLPVDRLLLEFDDPRSGGFDVLRFVPREKVAVLGLISTKVAEVESPDALLRRLEEASSFIDAGQLALSPQCGFATHAEGGNDLTEDEQYRKLAVAVETAQRFFGDA